MTALIQNFSVPADDDVAVTLKVDPNMQIASLEDCTIYWRAYNQVAGIPVRDASPPALIEKATTDGSVTVLPSPPMQCTINILRTDTVDLLRNYYHETTLVDVAGHVSTLNCGIMTVTDTRNRP